jgi:hypothetical protein
MIAFWTILHGILAMALLGAITHQGLAVWFTRRPAQNFVDRFRAVSADRYANAITLLYVVTFALGAFIYPTFVLDVKGSLNDTGMRKTIGVFQLKEHLAVIGLIMLPAYWQLWRAGVFDNDVSARKLLTTFLMLNVWWDLVVGHVLNNIKGLI